MEKTLIYLNLRWWLFATKLWHQIAIIWCCKLITFRRLLRTFSVCTHAMMGLFHRSLFAADWICRNIWNVQKRVKEKRCQVRWFSGKTTEVIELVALRSWSIGSWKVWMCQNSKQRSWQSKTSVSQSKLSKIWRNIKSTIFCNKNLWTVNNSTQNTEHKTVKPKKFSNQEIFVFLIAFSIEFSSSNSKD